MQLLSAEQVASANEFDDSFSVKVDAFYCTCDCPLSIFMATEWLPCWLCHTTWQNLVLCKTKLALTESILCSVLSGRYRVENEHSHGNARERDQNTCFLRMFQVHCDQEPSMLESPSKQLDDCSKMFDHFCDSLVDKKSSLQSTSPVEFPVSENYSVTVQFAAPFRQCYHHCITLSNDSIDTKRFPTKSHKREIQISGHLISSG